MSDLHGSSSSNSEKTFHPHPQLHHVTPLSVYYQVWMTLLIFTVVTVAVSYVDFGEMNLLVAMAIATIKALLVMFFFMGLKYDSNENRASFFSSFIFLGIFVVLTAFDVYHRETINAAYVDPSASSGGAPVDVKAVLAGGPEFVDKGKTLFQQNCATCHGPGGQGDGPAAAALNPKPRNFTSGDGWKNGRKLSQIFTTLTKGLGGMPAFAALSSEEKFALAHYIRTLAADAPQDSEGDMQALGLNGGAKKELTVEQAMVRLASGASSSEPVAYRYEPGVTPRTQYCRLPQMWRPRWCDANANSMMDGRSLSADGNLGGEAGVHSE